LVNGEKYTAEGGKSKILPTVEFNVKTTMPGEVSSESLLPPPQ
jgi:hypothetical protein